MLYRGIRGPHASCIALGAGVVAAVGRRRYLLFTGVPVRVAACSAFTVSPKCRELYGREQGTGKRFGVGCGHPHGS